MDRSYFNIKKQTELYESIKGQRQKMYLVICDDRDFACIIYLEDDDKHRKNIKEISNDKLYGKIFVHVGFEQKWNLSRFENSLSYFEFTSELAHFMNRIGYNSLFPNELNLRIHGLFSKEDFFKDFNKGIITEMDKFQAYKELKKREGKMRLQRLTSLQRKLKYINL